MTKCILSLLLAYASVEAQVAPQHGEDTVRDRVRDLQIRATEETVRQRDTMRSMERTQQDIQRMQIDLDINRALMAAPLAAPMALFQQTPKPAVAPMPPGVVYAPVKVTDEERLYRNGKSALEDREWDQALQSFNRIIERKGSRTDAALYWRAYVQNKLGRRNEALGSLESLVKEYSSSRWLDDAKALELEVKQSTGQPVSPDSEADEDLKLLALNGMIHTDPERAIPVLERLLQRGSSPRLKERALFVLAQSRAPKSREVLLKLAKGGTNPDLQYKAVEFLGYQSTPETRQALSEIYSASSDNQLKRAVIRGFAASRDKERLLATAKAEQTFELRREAVRGLGSMDANPELWQLYQSESSKEMKMEILRALPGRKENVDKLVEAAKAEKEPSLRAELYRQIGYSRTEKGGELLASLYSSESDPEVRRAIIGAIRSQNNAKILVDIARAETDPKLKRTLVETLSHMKSKEASDYLLEVLNK